MYTYGNNEPDFLYSVSHGGRHGIIHCAPVAAGLPARLPVRTVHGTVKMSQPTAKNTSTLARVCGFQLPTFQRARTRTRVHGVGVLFYFQFRNPFSSIPRASTSSFLGLLGPFVMRLQPCNEHGTDWNQQQVGEKI